MSIKNTLYIVHLSQFPSVLIQVSKSLKNIK
jgi:hypothetical protein